MSLSFPPISLTNGVFDVTVSGRTLTPVGLLLVGGVLLYPNPILGPVTLTGIPDGVQYDLAVIAIDGSTYGLASYALGTTPIDMFGVWVIGTYWDYPSQSRCQVLLSSSLAFQSDQYVAVEQDGLHVKAFGGTSISYGKLWIESTTGINNASIYADDATVFIQSPLALSVQSLGTGSQALFGNSKGPVMIAAGSALGHGQLSLTSYIDDLIVKAFHGGNVAISTGTGALDQGSISLTAGNVTGGTGGLNFTAWSSSVWSNELGNVTIQAKAGSMSISALAPGNQLHLFANDTGGILIETTGTTTHSGNITIQAAGTGTLSLTTSTGSLTVQSSAGTLSLLSSTGLTVTNSTSGTMAFTNTGRAINFTGSTLTMHGGITADTSGLVQSQGTSAGFAFYDRAGSPGNNSQWYRDATNFKMNTTEGGDIWTVNATTGQVTQGAFTNVTYQNSWVTATGYIAVSYRKDFFGTIHMRGSAMSGAAGTIVCTLPSGFRPSGTLPFACAFYNGTAWSSTVLYIDSSGAVTCIASGVPAGSVIAFNDIHFDTL